MTERITQTLNNDKDSAARHGTAVESSDFLTPCRPLIHRQRVYQS